MSKNFGGTTDNPLDAPIGELNALQHSNTQRIVNDDLFSVLAASSAESLKAKDVIGTGNLKGIVIGIVSTGNSPYDREKRNKEQETQNPSMAMAKRQFKTQMQAHMHMLSTYQN